MTNFLNKSGFASAATTISGFSGISSVKISLTSAQILAGFTTPILCIPEPPAGFAIRVLDSSAHLIFNTTAYSTSTFIMLLTDTAIVEQKRILILNATVSTHRLLVEVLATDIAETQIITGKAIYAKIKNANPTLGNSTVNLYITYELIAL